MLLPSTDHDYVGNYLEIRASQVIHQIDEILVPKIGFLVKVFIDGFDHAAAIDSSRFFSFLLAKNSPAYQINDGMHA